MTFFSVIIPLYNKVNFIKDCLESVLNQSYQNFEVIVVNDGSTDGSEQIIENIKDSRLRLIHQNNKGASAARNLGVEKAQYEWIALLDADDYWYPDHLEELNNTILKFPEANVICNNYEVLLNNTHLKQPSYSLNEPFKAQYIQDYFEASQIDALGWTSALGFTKKIFNDVGGFDEQIKSGQDTDLMIRLGLSSIIAFNPEVTARYITQSENNLAKSKSISDRIKIFKKYIREEKEISSLKTFLDSNRFALTILYKMNRIPEWKSIRKDIDLKNLNSKQRFLLKLPGTMLRILKSVQTFLIKQDIYQSAHR
ncbi:glycosyltransferase family 2 protein [Psychroflexus tropicus]|uniref:glycosyltransferase family 2 protein n=1 Tax=Psychroflexus tropicus TaxID=197345 RepID=UPI00036BCAA9|nr:glycosyltransferase family 2 protein [Psychroflexus tropicus]